MLATKGPEWEYLSSRGARSFSEYIRQKVSGKLRQRICSAVNASCQTYDIAGLMGTSSASLYVEGAAGIWRRRITLQIISQHTTFVPEETPGKKISPSVPPRGILLNFLWKIEYTLGVRLAQDGRCPATYSPA